MCQNFKNIVKEIKDEGRAEGHAEGKTEGLHLEKLNVIERMNRLGVSIELIAASVAMSVSEVQNVLGNS